MGIYRCPLSEKLKPSKHDEVHWDGFSNVCPILREEMEKALENENYKRLKKLIKMGEDNGLIK